MYLEPVWQPLITYWKALNKLAIRDHITKFLFRLFQGKHKTYFIQ